MPKTELNLTDQQFSALMGVLADRKPEQPPAQKNEIEYRSKLGKLLPTAPDDQAICVNVTLHAKQWREALAIIEYRRSKGDRKCVSLSGLFWYMIDKNYIGMTNATKAAEPSDGPDQETGEEDEGDEQEDDPLFASRKPRKAPR